MYGVGSLLWVKRKNGRWWPARIVGLNEIPPSFNNLNLYSSNFPIMLLGRSSSSLEWFNMKSKRVKPFRCGEFDDCIKEAASSESSKCFDEGGMIGDTGKSARRREAILHALAIENEEHRKKLKQAGDAPSETVRKPKRLKTTCVLRKTQSLTVGKSRVRSESSLSVIRLKIASTETPTHSCGDNNKNSGQSQRQLKSMTVKEQGQSINWPESLNCNTGALTNQNEEGDDHYGGDTQVNQNKVALQKCRQVMAGQLAPDETSRVVKKIFKTETAHNTDINFFDSALIDQQKKTQTMLVDVDVMVQKVSREDHVPFICMISKTSQRPIIGHPVDVEVVGHSSGPLFGKANGTTKYSFGVAGNQVPKLVWKKAKRSPVLYSPTSELPNTSVAIQSFSHSKANGSGKSRATQSVGNNLRNHTMSNDHTLLHAVKNRTPVDANGRVNCVPVKHIFNGLLATVG